LTVIRKLVEENRAFFMERWNVASLLNAENFMRLANSYADFPVKKTKSGPALKKRTTRKSANKR